MKNLLDAPRLEDVLGRLDRLHPDTTARWGEMDVAQMMAHCAGFLEVAVGDQKPPRALIGRLIGGFVKSRAFNDAPLPHNMSTIPEFRVVEPNASPRKKTA